MNIYLFCFPPFCIVDNCFLSFLGSSKGGQVVVPSVRCPSCSHANDLDFRFCQRCGYKRKTTVLPNHGSLGSESLQAIDERLHQLTLFSEATSYSKQKDSLQKELKSFLGSLPGRPSLTSVTP